MAQRKLKIRDLTLRDGQQSLFATRLSQAEIDKLLPSMKMPASISWKYGEAQCPIR